MIVCRGAQNIGFFNPLEKNLSAEKHYTKEWDCFSIQKHVIKETGPKVGCFSVFCDHRLMIMSDHTHVYRYPLFESGMKTGLKTITLCRKDGSAIK